MVIASVALYLVAKTTIRYCFTGRFHYFMVGAFEMIRHFRTTIGVLIVLSVFTPFVPRRLQFWFQFYVAITLALLAVPMVYRRTDPMTYALGGLVIPLVLISSWLYLRSNVSAGRKWRSTIFYSLFFWALVGGAAFWLWQHSYYHQLNRYWQLRPQFIWISMLVLVWHKHITKKDTVQAFLPVNALRGVLWPYDLNLEDPEGQRRKIWWNGYCNLLLGFSVLLFRVWLERGLLHDFRYIDPYRISGHVLTILGDVGALNLISGMARMFGYKVRDATNFVFFARTPADIWRRSSTYNYLFVLRCVYMPLFKICRNFFIVSFISFLVFFINHHGLWNFLQIGGHLTGLRPIQSKPELFKMAVFFLHFLCVYFLLYFTRRRWFFRWKDMGNAKVAWTSIVITHALRLMARAFSWTVAVHFFG